MLADRLTVFIHEIPLKLHCSPHPKSKLRLGRQVQILRGLGYAMFSVEHTAVCLWVIWGDVKVREVQAFSQQQSTSYTEYVQKIVKKDSKR